MLANCNFWYSTQKASSQMMNIFITLMLLAVVTANAVTPEIPTISDNENQFPDMLSNEQHDGFDAEKRNNWQRLQGGWGKRADMEDDSDNQLTDHIIPVVLATGDSMNNKLQLAFLTNAATLEHLANDMDNDSDIINQKRAWKSMAVGWGKRRNAPTWNKFGGGWGKRESNWNNLKGMWGKRASNWGKLQAGWGKRSAAAQQQLYPAGDMN